MTDDGLTPADEPTADADAAAQALAEIVDALRAPGSPRELADAAAAITAFEAVASSSDRPITEQIGRGAAEFAHLDR